MSLVTGPLREGELNYVGTGDSRAVASELYSALFRRCLKPRDKPVVTRFWLFTDCVNIQVLLDILGISWDKLLSMPTVYPRKVSSRRINRILAYYGRPRTPQREEKIRTVSAELRRVGLALRITMH